MTTPAGDNIRFQYNIHLTVDYTQAHSKLEAGALILALAEVTTDKEQLAGAHMRYISHSITKIIWPIMQHTQSPHADTQLTLIMRTQCVYTWHACLWSNAGLGQDVLKCYMCIAACSVCVGFGWHPLWRTGPEPSAASDSWSLMRVLVVLDHDRFAFKLAPAVAFPNAVWLPAAATLEPLTHMHANEQKISMKLLVWAKPKRITISHS